MLAVEGESLDAEVGGPLVEPEAFVEVAGGPPTHDRLTELSLGA